MVAVEAFERNAAAGQRGKAYEPQRLRSLMSYTSVIKEAEGPAAAESTK
jgi:hypothetical protein